MSLANNVLVRPVLSEKASGVKEAKKYVFEVATSTNKIEVKRAIESQYKVKVDKVNIVNMKPKKKRFRSNVGFSKSWKKAVVTLVKGEIDFYK